MTDNQSLSLNDFYTQILRSSMQDADEGGNIYQSTMVGHQGDPSVVSGRTLYLPTTHRLKNIKGDELFFHPLSEQLTRGQSTVFRNLRRMATLRLATSITNIGYAILRLQEHPEIQSKMSRQEQDFIKGLVDTDKNSAAAWLKMNILPIERDSGRTEKWVVSIFLKNNGQYNGKNYRRVAVTSFPAFEYVAGGGTYTRGEGADEKEMFRPKDYVMVKQLAETMFPGYLNPGFSDYNSGYDGATGPYLVAFFRAYKLVADRLNHILDLFKTSFEAANLGDVEANRILTQWSNIICTEEGIDDLVKLARRVPALKGNIGSIDGKDELELDNDKAEPAPAAKTVQRDSEPVKQPVSQESKKDDGLTDEHRKMIEEAKRRQIEYAEEEKLWKERNEQSRRREEEDRYGRRESRYDPRDDYPNDSRRDDPPWEEPPRSRETPKAANGKVSFDDILDRNRELSKDIDRREHDDSRGDRYGRGRYEERRDQYGRRETRRDSRDYDRYESRYDNRHERRDYDRGDRYGRGRYEERRDQYGRRY